MIHKKFQKDLKDAINDGRSPFKWEFDEWPNANDKYRDEETVLLNRRSLNVQKRTC